MGIGEALSFKKIGQKKRKSKTDVALGYGLFKSHGLFGLTFSYTKWACITLANTRVDFC